MTISEQISKFFGGMDKVAHFGIGGLLCGMITLFMFCLMPMTLVAHPFLMTVVPLVGYIVVGGLSIFKELKLDIVADWKDVWMSIFGCVLVHIAAIIGMIVYLIIR